MLTLQQIIAEADISIPNDFSVSDKVSWLNNINQDFFNIVKIPKITKFNTTSGVDVYTLPNDVRKKNIDLVLVGLLKYRDMDEETKPLQNVYTFDDTTKKLTLIPGPYQSDLTGIVRYHQIATTTFLSSDLNATPDAPEEYHWTFVPALCEQIALAMDDGEKAANYANQYRTAWNVAAQNYQKAGRLS